MFSKVWDFFSKKNMILTRSLDFFILPAVTKLILEKAQFAREPVYILTPIPLLVEELDDERERIIKLIRSYLGDIFLHLSTEP